MSLKKIIRKVLKEEFIEFSQLNQLKRRTHLIDKSIEKFIKHLHPEYYATKQKYLDKLIGLVLEDLHGKYFVYAELSDEEWDIYKNFIISYITNNF
jgi:Holliday junction resolvasome RuvABC endonuclease subunit